MRVVKLGLTKRALRFFVRSCDRMAGGWIHTSCVIDTTLGVASSVNVFRFVRGCQRDEERLHGLRQGFESGKHTGKERIATRSRQDMQLQHGRQWWALVTGHIGVQVVTVGDL